MNFVIGFVVAMLWMLISLCVVWLLFIKTHLWIPLVIIAIIIAFLNLILEIIDLGRNTRKLIKELIRNAK